MRIKVPKQHLDKFDKGKAYIMRWKDKSVLITNERMKRHIENNLEKIIESGNDESAFARMFKAGVFEVELDSDGAIECPDWLKQWLGNGKLHYKKDELGILVSSQKSK